MDGVRIIVFAAVFWLSVAALGCVAVGGGRGAPEIERRANALNKTIMCPLCPGESIDQSQNPLSIQMRAAVSEKLAEGWTDDQIREFFVERYGPSVLLEPPTEGFGLAAWIVPPAAFGAALAALLFALRRMTASRPPDGSGGGDASGARGSHLARIRDALGDADGGGGANADAGARRGGGDDDDGDACGAPKGGARKGGAG